MSRRPRRFSWLLAWVLLAVFSGWVTAQARVTVHDLRTKKKRTYQQQHLLSKKLRHVKQQRRQVSQELRTAQTNLDWAERRLAQTRQQLGIAEKKLAQASAELQKTERRLQAHTDDLWKRLNVFYQRGTIGYLEVVLEATDFADFANRTALLQTVVNHDTSLLREIQAERQKRAALEAEMRAKRVELARLRQRQMENRRMIRVQAARKRQLLQSLDRDRLTYERSLVEIEASRRQIEQLIRRLTRPPVRRSGKSYGRLPGRISGRLSWPVGGGVTDGFGYRIHPVWKTRRFHDGIDLSAPYGTTVRAGAAGRVIHSGWMGAYGRAVIIDHGGGLTTLYGHCSSLLVGCGAQVSKGQAIARVGSTGISTGNHVHYSTYIYGKAVNPSTVR